MTQLTPDNSTSRATVKARMIASYEEHVDPKTGELNTTKLTEDVAEQLNLYLDDNATIDDEWYHVAYEVEQVLVKRGLVEPITGR